MYARSCLDVPVHVSAKVDYAMRALLELAASYKQDPHTLVRGDDLATAQAIPMKFLEAILRDLRSDGIIASKRGIDGGYRLDKVPTEVMVADVVRALEGPLAAVRGERPEDVIYDGSAKNLQTVWIAARVAIRSVLEQVSLQQIIDGDLPADVAALLKSPGAWERRS